MNTYKCYDAVAAPYTTDYERITAETSFEARGVYARRHGIHIHDVVALRIPAERKANGVALYPSR